MSSVKSLHKRVILHSAAYRIKGRVCCATYVGCARGEGDVGINWSRTGGCRWWRAGWLAGRTWWLIISLIVIKHTACHHLHVNT